MGMGIAAEAFFGVIFVIVGGKHSGISSQSIFKWPANCSPSVSCLRRLQLMGVLAFLSSGELSASWSFMVETRKRPLTPTVD